MSENVSDPCDPASTPEKLANIGHSRSTKERKINDLKELEGSVTLKKMASLCKVIARQGKDLTATPFSK
jgi:hypothetical protein